MYSYVHTNVSIFTSKCIHCTFPSYVGDTNAFEAEDRREWTKYLLKAADSSKAVAATIEDNQETYTYTEMGTQLKKLDVDSALFTEAGE